MRVQDPVRTVQGFCHVQLAVTDVEASRRFYGGVFGLELKASEGDVFVILRTPGQDDSLALRSDVPADVVGKSAGVLHIGFHVPDGADVDRVCALTESFGGQVSERGIHPRGEVFAYLRDPSGYLVEVSGPPRQTDASS